MRTVAVTGGARGIGRAIAAAFLAAGDAVAIGDLDAATSAQVAAELGHGCVGLALDVTDAAGFAAFLDAVQDRLGPVDVLVNNAGVMLLSGVPDELPSSVDHMLDVNLRGVITGSRLALVLMQGRGRGHIVNVASTLGQAALPGAATYCATKFAVVGFTEALRAELRGTGLRLSLVMPGLVDTELGAGVRSIPGVRTCRPEDVARATVAAVDRGRFEVFVPARAGWIVKAMALIPRRPRELLVGALKLDHVFLTVDDAERAVYRDRLAS